MHIPILHHNKTKRVIKLTYIYASRFLHLLAQRQHSLRRAYWFRIRSPVFILRPIDRIDILIVPHFTLSVV